ncbi:MAG: 16S rRNA (guanine(966)-N(2))-methyltransferase RsmD [Pseudomonadota bacterium]|nr:16S rRNA (guanine(966)-N(2))-methyltransferase RsmD [Pseudomonadota bacterium]
MNNNNKKQLPGYVRVTGGYLKNKKLFVPPGKIVRPTTDKARIAIFNKIQHGLKEINFCIKNKIVADLFSGTAILGIEAISRGASDVSFYETNPLSLEYIRKNIALTKTEDKSVIFCHDATKLYKSKKTYDLIMIDPPYKSGLAQKTLEVVSEYTLLANNGLLLIETEENEKINCPRKMKIIESKSYGSSRFSFICMR